MTDIKYNNKIGAVLIGIFSISILVAFSKIDTANVDSQKQNATPSLVQQKLKEKLDKFENTILEKCRKEAIDDAEIFVDSLVSEELNSLAGDTIAFPRKPIKPTLPQKIILNDSTKIDPILQEY